MVAGSRTRIESPGEVIGAVLLRLDMAVSVTRSREMSGRDSTKRTRRLVIEEILSIPLGSHNLRN